MTEFIEITPSSTNPLDTPPENLDIDEIVRKWSYNIARIVTQSLHIQSTKTKADTMKEVSEALKPLVLEVAHTHIEQGEPLPKTLREWKEESFESHEDYLSFSAQFESDNHLFS